MKLSSLLNASPAIEKLATKELPAKLAYQLLKYALRIAAECDVIEKRRVAIVHEITGTEPGTEARIEAGTEDFGEYARRFSEFLSQDSDLEKSDIMLSSIVEALGDSAVLTVQDLASLEKLFE
jgi:hypothetical protein